MDAIVYNKIKTEADRIIAAIQQGGGDSVIKYVTRMANMFSMANNLPNKIKISPIQLSAGNNNESTFYRAYEEGSSVASIDYTLEINQSTPFSLYQHLFQAYGIKNITIAGNLQYCTSYRDLFDYCSGLRTINIEFDFSSCTDANSCSLIGNGTNAYVTDLRFKPNTLSYSISALTHFTAVNAATLVSLANCLRSDVTGQTVTLTDAQKDICNNTTGVISGGLFVEDASGSVTLTSFITNTKGWTIA